MPIPTSTTSFANIQNELGGTIPISLSEYYNVSGKFGFGITGIPTSGQLSVNNFRGKSKPANISISISGTNNTFNNVTDNANYRYALFTNNGTFSINGNLNCDILIVGGGGGGGKSELTDGNNGRYGGGGGGSGDVLYIQNYNLNSGSYNINIGLGGSGGTGGNNSTNGGNTTINSNSSIIIGAGGGGGGADAQSNSGKAGTIITSIWGNSSGGGGGGGGNLGNSGSGNTYSGNGANGTTTGDEGGGGGGGPVNNGSGINGGSGLTINIIGTNNVYGGGAGGQRNKSWVPGSAGGTDYGSGGGTSQNGNGGIGRTGVVIIRYSINNVLMAISGTGNTINNLTENSNYKYAYFANNGTFTTNSNLICDILIVGGGGGGGFDGAGGGGGGQVLYYTDNSVSFKSGNSITLNSGTYNINIGSSGTGSTATGEITIPQAQSINGTNGGTSTIINASTSTTILSAKGGAGGGARNNLGNGGDVGGAGGNGHANSGASQISNNGGGSGGTNNGDVRGGGGGGGGANTSGTSKNGENNQPSSNRAGNGGAGVDINITGTNVGYGGGGGGGSWTYVGGTATHGGGSGNITNSNGNPQAGTANRGGGGGSGGRADTGNASGMNGGTGVVIIRYINNYNKNYPILKDSNGNNINPTAWYKFDDTTNIGVDSSGNGVNLTNYNYVGYITNYNVYGTGSASFNSANSRYLLGTGVNIDNKSFSISFWVYPTSVSDVYIYAKDNAQSVRGALHIGYRTSTNFTFAFWGDDLEVSVSNHLNKWNFFTCTYNVSNNQQIVYVNGVLTTSRTSGGALNSANQIYNIGRSFIAGNYFSGYLDDFRIYSGLVLTQSQVLELYNDVL